MPDVPVEAVAFAFGSFTGNPTWDELIDPASGGAPNIRWVILHIENTTNVRVQISFDGSAVHANIDAGDDREWTPDSRVPISGTISVRASSAGEPTSGDVTADGVV